MKRNKRSKACEDRVTWRWHVCGGAVFVTWSIPPARPQSQNVKDVRGGLEDGQTCLVRPASDNNMPSNRRGPGIRPG